MTCFATDWRRALEGTSFGFNGSKGSTKFSNKARMASSVGQASEVVFVTGKVQSTSSIERRRRNCRGRRRRIVKRRRSKKKKVEIFILGE